MYETYPAPPVGSVMVVCSPFLPDGAKAAELMAICNDGAAWLLSKIPDKQWPDTRSWGKKTYGMCGHSGTNIREIH